MSLRILTYRQFISLPKDEYNNNQSNAHSSLVKPNPQSYTLDRYEHFPRNHLSFKHYFPFLFHNLAFASGNSKEDTVIADVYKAIVRIEVIPEKGSGGRMMKSRSTEAVS